MQRIDRWLGLVLALLALLPGFADLCAARGEDEAARAQIAEDKDRLAA